ncbi:MAG: PEP-CTERM sorting domain-containing protein, partial [Tepidisphaeraceae bacterium]
GIFNHSGGTNTTGSLQLGNTGNGAYFLSGGTLAVTGPITIGTQGGTGNLFIANVTATAASVTNSNGDISLAGANDSNSAGDLTITGDYTQCATAELDVGIGGANAGTEYSVVAVGGNATLDGTLGIDLENGFTSPFGQTFEIIDAGSLTGTFSKVNSPYQLEMDYTSTGLFITFVPEPSGIGLLALAAGLLLRRRRPNTILSHSIRSI